MKKLTAFLTALLCMSNLILPVSAKYYDGCREAILSTDEENIIFIGDELYMPLYSLEPKLKGYVITTDGTDLTEETVDFAFDAVSWNEWYAHELASQEVFDYLCEIPQPEDPDHAYFVYLNTIPSDVDASAELIQYAQMHDFVADAQMLKTVEYQHTYPSNSLSLVFQLGEYTAWDFSTPSAEDFPELAVFGEDVEFEKDITAYRENTDGEIGFYFNIGKSDYRSENHLTSAKDVYYFWKNVERQLNENHPEITAVAWFGYDFSAEDTLSSYTLESVLKSVSGDANGDGAVNILDVIFMNKAILGTGTLKEEQLKAIDFNGNGKPDAEESLSILKFIIGLIDTF